MNKIPQIKAVRGMADILPEESLIWADIENSARRIFARYGYGEIRTPILEETPLFKRSIGQATDIVQKEMYSFADRGGRNLTLRPEATACVVRAFLEHHLHKKSPLNKLFYIGPMFRSERPQAGRQRQFHQLGVEALGSDSPYLDAEVITLLSAFLEAQGVIFRIKINSLGCAEDKKRFASELTARLKPKAGALCADCRLRIDRNVFRVLDCKNESCRRVARSVPSVKDPLCSACKGHFDEVTGALDYLGVNYIKDEFLVRGLDYYTRTVFEVACGNLGAHDAVAAGGRYDGLVESLGGPSVPAAGFAIGIERLLKAKGTAGCEVSPGAAKVFIIALGEAAFIEGLKLADGLRRAGIGCGMDYLRRPLKAQLKRASKEGFAYAAILGENELEKGEIILRDMNKGRQESLKIGEFHQRLKKLPDCMEIH